MVNRPSNRAIKIGAIVGLSLGVSIGSILGYLGDPDGFHRYDFRSMFAGTCMVPVVCATVGAGIGWCIRD